MNGYWFSSKRGGDWMTPEKYEVFFKVSRIANGEKDRSFLDNYYMCDPRNEVNNGIARVTKLTADLQAFSERVFAYFNQAQNDSK
jgi:hypothetical protein